MKKLPNVLTASAVRSRRARFAGLFLAIAALAGVATPAAAGPRLDRINESKVLRVGTPGDYRPFAIKSTDGAIHAKVVIDEVALVDPGGASAKQLEQILRVIAAIANPAATEDLTAIDEVAVWARRRRHGLWEAGPKLAADALVGIEAQDPRSRDLNAVECPPPLAGVALERIGQHFGAESLGDFDGVVGAS